MRECDNIIVQDNPCLNTLLLSIKSIRNRNSKSNRTIVYTDNAYRLINNFICVRIQTNYCTRPVLLLILTLMGRSKCDVVCLLGLMGNMYMYMICLLIPCLAINSMITKTAYHFVLSMWKGSFCWTSADSWFRIIHEQLIRIKGRLAWAATGISSLVRVFWRVNTIENCLSNTAFGFCEVFNFLVNFLPCCFLCPKK